MYNDTPLIFPYISMINQVKKKKKEKETGMCGESPCMIWPLIFQHNLTSVALNI